MTTTDRTGADDATFEARMAELDRLEVADEDTVERVARAIRGEWASDAHAASYDWDHRQVDREFYRRVARAAIAALKPAPGTARGVWRHFRFSEPHEAVPVPGTEYDDPSGKLGARCANCGNGEAIGLNKPAPGTARGGQVVQRVLDLADRHERSAKHRRRLAERWMDAERYQLADAFRRLARQSETESARIRDAVSGGQS